MAPRTTFRAVTLNEMVVSVAVNKSKPIITTPAREIVMISVTRPKGMATMHRSLSNRGSRDVSAVTMSGVIVTINTERLLDSSTVPGTR